MIVKTADKVEGENVAGDDVKGVMLRVLVGEKDSAPNFVMRQFNLEPGGYTPKHSHAWEHEVFVLDGRGTVFGGGREESLARGKAVFVPGNEEHQFRAADDSGLVFLCIIPKI